MKSNLLDLLHNLSKAQNIMVNKYPYFTGDR